MSNIIIIGFPDGSKVPGAYGETKFRQSPMRFGASALKVLLCGLKATSGGNLTVDTEVRRLLSKDDADTAWGAGGEGAAMAYSGMDEVAGLAGVEFYGCAPTGFGGAAATLTLTVTGTATSSGSIYIGIGGDVFEVAITSGDAQNTVASKINTEAGKQARLQASCGVATNVDTFTAKQAGIRGNDLTCYVDFSGVSGVTIALGGAGSALTSSSVVVGRTFGGGTGTESLTAMLATLLPLSFDFVAPAQNDATSLAAWETQADTKAGPLENKTEHLIVASRGNFAAVTSLAQTTLNNERFCMLWLEASEKMPAQISAAFAAVRAVNEVVNPNSAYDGYKLKTVKAQRFQSYWCASYTAKQAALDVGVTPLESKSDAGVYIVRAITTRCLDGTTPDYRCLDVAQSYVPDYVRKRLSTHWSTSFVVANPYVRPDPAASEEVPSQVAYPALWNDEVIGQLKDMERSRIVTQVASHLPSSEYNYAADRIMSAVPVVPLPHQHQVGLSVRQMNVAA